MSTSEPTSALDVSYLLITHNIGVVEYVADFVAVMNRGRVDEAGAVEAEMQRPRADSTRALPSAVPRIESINPR